MTTRARSPLFAESQRLDGTGGFHHKTHSLGDYEELISCWDTDVSCYGDKAMGQAWMRHVFRIPYETTKGTVVCGPGPQRLDAMSSAHHLVLSARDAGFIGSRSRPIHLECWISDSPSTPQITLAS
ncbi:hypothetical protein BDV09DRAFT_187716 [Aspergillus tetrazonus]